MKLPDLLVGAIAETQGLTIMHYDADFDRIAEVTGQPSQWVVEAGTVLVVPGPRLAGCRCLTPVGKPRGKGT